MINKNVGCNQVKSQYVERKKTLEKSSATSAFRMLALSKEKKNTGSER